MGEDQGIPINWERWLSANVQELRVGNATNMKDLATQILRLHDEGKRVVLSCIGQAAVNVATKALAHGNGELAKQGKLLVSMPCFELKTFADRDTGKEIEMTSIKLLVGRMPIVF